MSNKSQPHRKFVQTFVLAGQTNGYFVLNDIFRYIREDEEDEVVPEVAEPEPEPEHSEYKELLPTANDSVLKSLNETKETAAPEPDVAEVDKKLEEVAHKEEAEETATPAQTNGTPVPEAEEVISETEAPAVAVSTPEEPAAEEAPIIVAEEPVQADKPKAPAPTPAPAKATPPPVAAAPPKPAVPKSWAQLVAPKAPIASAPAPAQAAAPQPKAAAPTLAATQPKHAATSAPTAPARQPSPAGSQQEGSSGGWQTAGAEHNRSKSRAQAPIVGLDGKVRAYVKNVYAGVDADELKAHLTKFGELAYFDVSRAKVCLIYFDHNRSICMKDMIFRQLHFQTWNLLCDRRKDSGETFRRIARNLAGLVCITSLQ
jgi:chemotaxis protein histidine kinase CheA